MNETPRFLPSRIETIKGRKNTIRTAIQVIYTTILILSLGLAIVLPLGWITVNSAQAATTVTDPVNLVNTTDTSLFSTPNDPTDDTIDYTPNTDWTGDDTFMYQICDSTLVCVQATVTVTVTPATLVSSLVASPSLAPKATVSTLEANDDPATVVVNTALEPSFVNIYVLGNDDFGPNGPATGPITIFSSPTNGVATVSNGPRSPDSAGLAYLRGHSNTAYTDKLIISDSEVNEPFPGAAYTGVNLFITDIFGSLDSTLSTYDPPKPLPFTFSDEPTGVAYNPTNNHLFFTDDTGIRRLYELNPGIDGFYNTADDFVSNFNLSAIGGTDPEGVAYDSWRDHVIVVDGVGEEVYDIDLVDGTLNGNETVTHFDVGSIGIDDPEGIEFNPDNGHLFIVDRSTNLIAETTIDGTLFRFLDTTSINPIHLAGLAYAPASGTPGQKNLYIVDRGIDNNSNSGDPFENDGKMYEVSFSADVPPAVGAGPDQAITLPAIATLDGTVIDGRHPSGAMTTLWSKISGPGWVTFADENALDTSASFDIPGDYILRLTANDGTRVGIDEITITVNPVSNQPPFVDAGSDQMIILTEAATLDGFVIDDGLPFPPALTTEWTKVSGPGHVTFINPNAVDTNATFSIDGVYTLRLTANDGELSASDEAIITVTQSPNQPPFIDTGPNQTITLPDTASLDGTGTDDGLPDPPGSFTTLWSVVSGPGLVNFADANAVDTIASFSKTGVYELLLTADDGEQSAIDTLMITINPAPMNNVWLPVLHSNSANR
jgi:hypothetical protein